MRVSENMMIKKAAKANNVFKSEMAICLFVLAIIIIIERVIARTDVVKPPKEENDITPED
jgi:hypothetical protein